MTHKFIVPIKRLTDGSEMEQFFRSPAYRILTGYIKSLDESVIGIPTNAKIEESANVARVISLLKEVERLTDETPLEPETSQRFGNKAFRVFHEKLVSEATLLHEKLLPPSLHCAIIEFVPYLLDSFGNSTRIDYGSGHELHFVAWLALLAGAGVLTHDDRRATVLRVFAAYLRLCRKIQTKFKLEPAGSHGVWSIDDYQFLPFYFGAAQLIDHPTIVPDSILDPKIVKEHQEESLYLEAIQFILDHKRGPFFEHSPDLYNISSAASWQKINSGMFKKYQAECLSKFVIIQHFLFGSLLKFDEKENYD